MVGDVLLIPVLNRFTESLALAHVVSQSLEAMIPITVVQYVEGPSVRGNSRLADLFRDVIRRYRSTGHPGRGAEYICLETCDGHEVGGVL